MAQYNRSESLVVPDIRNQNVNAAQAQIFEKGEKKSNDRKKCKFSELLKQVVDQLVRYPGVSFLLSTVNEELESNPDLLKGFLTHSIWLILRGFWSQSDVTLEPTLEPHPIILST